jgi:prevent-host-death family protein
MTSVGVRELREQTSAIVKRVREEGETVDVTYRGRVVARIVPVDPPRPDPEELERWLEGHRRLGEEISKVWPKGVSAVDAVREQRREF